MILRFTVWVVYLSVISSAHAEDWRMYLHDPAHSSVNAVESQISVSNVPSLGQAWSLSLGSGLASAVTAVDGVLYFGDWDGYFNAVKASDGSIIWRQSVGISAPPQSEGCPPAIGVTSQAVVVGNTVYVGGGDSAVYALHKSSGQQLWRTELADPASGSYLWSSLTRSGNSLYIGIASLGDCPLIRGALVRIDLADPSHPVFRYLAPEDATGAGIWSTPAIDESTNTVYVTTGTGEQDADAGLFGGTFLALDGKTLETKAYFFLPTNSTDFDIEWGSSPVLFESSDGTPFTAATGKDGVLYALNRADLSLAWTSQLAVECICPECGCGGLSTPAFDGKRLYVGAGVADVDSFSSGSVYAIDASTGETAWMQNLTGTVIAPVTVANGVVYVSTLAGVFAFDAQSGEYLWDDGGYGLTYSQPVVVDGTLYTTYLMGDVVAWRLMNAQAANASGSPGSLIDRHDHGVQLGAALGRVQTHWQGRKKSP